MQMQVLPESFNPNFFDALATHFVQSWVWGDIRKKTGTNVVRLGFLENNTLKNIAQITFHPLPKIGRTMGHLAKCAALTSDELDELIKVGRANRAIAIRIEPNLLVGEWTIYHKQLKKSKQNIFIPHNFLVDLTQSEETLLQNMHPKMRYNIKVAQKHGVVIEQKTDTETLEAFIALQKETAGRQKFYLHPDAYYRTVLSELAPKQMATMLVAKHPENGQVLTIWFLVMFKKTLTYLYGASSTAYKNIMASNLVAWEAMKLGKARGMTEFDFGGTLGLDAQPSNPRYGFHKFKEGFGGKHVSYVGTFDLVVESKLYPLFVAAEKLRWWLLRLKK